MKMLATKRLERVTGLNPTRAESAPEEGLRREPACEAGALYDRSVLRRAVRHDPEKSVALLDGLTWRKEAPGANDRHRSGGWEAPHVSGQGLPLAEIDALAHHQEVFDHLGLMRAVDCEP
jgi:hypothetical protein